MIDRQTVFEILRLDHEGLSIQKISDALCLSRKTVAKYIDDPYPQRKSAKRASNWTPLKKRSHGCFKSTRRPRPWSSNSV